MKVTFGIIVSHKISTKGYLEEVDHWVAENGVTLYFTRLIMPANVLLFAIEKSLINHPLKPY